MEYEEELLEYLVRMLERLEQIRDTIDELRDKGLKLPDLFGARICALDGIHCVKMMHKLIVPNGGKEE